MPAITVGKTATGFVVRIAHHGTLRESRALAEFAASMPHGQELSLDLSKADYLDSTFLGSLMGLHKRTNMARNGTFRICGPVVHVRRLMGKTRLDTVLPLVDGVPSTLGEEQEIPQAATESAELAHFIADAHRKLAELGGPDSPAYAKVAERIDEETRTHPRG